MPSDTSSSSASPSVSGLRATASSNSGTSGLGSNRTLVITLSTVLSVVGVLLFVGAVLIYLKYRRRRVPFLSRGISPIGDDEIATWKASGDEKAALAENGADAGVNPIAPAAPQGQRHGTHASTSSIKKPPTVIIYQGRSSQQLQRHSGEVSPRSVTHNPSGYKGKTSLDKELPHTPIQAVAPNARAGLTDRAVPGDDPFLPSPKRHPSRLSKAHSSVTSPRSAHMHTRSRSSRSSTRSFGGDYPSSDMELSPRSSNDYYNNIHCSFGSGHGRIYSSSSVPPRLSSGEDGTVGGLSPRPTMPDSNMIGRAIG